MKRCPYFRRRLILFAFLLAWGGIPNSTYPQEQEAVESLLEWLSGDTVAVSGFDAERVAGASASLYDREASEALARRHRVPDYSDAGAFLDFAPRPPDNSYSSLTNGGALAKIIRRSSSFDKDVSAESIIAKYKTVNAGLNAQPILSDTPPANGRAQVLAMVQRMIDGTAKLPPGVTPEDIVRLIAQLTRDDTPSANSSAATKGTRALIFSIPTTDPHKSTIVHVTEGAAGVSARMTRIPTDDLNDSFNSEVLQNKPLQSALRTSKYDNPKTTAIPSNDPIDPKLVVAHSRSTDFPFVAVSDPARIQFNLLRLNKRPFSSRVCVLDFSPRTTGALDEMRLDTAALSHWRKVSKKISQLATKGDTASVTGAIVKNGSNLSVDDLFAEIGRSNGEGTVLILYGHCAGKDIFLHTRDGVERLTPQFIEQQLNRLDPGTLPSIVLLSCEARTGPAEAFLSSGAPLVFATDKKIPIDRIGKFLEALNRNVYRKKMDVIDGIFHAIKTDGPSRMAPLVEDFGVGVTSSPFD